MDTGTTTNPTATTTFSMANMAFIGMPLGTIRIGHSIRMPDGREMPISSDEFRITQPVRDKDGHWEADPMDGQLRQALKVDGADVAPKLRVIPIKFLSDDPSLAVRARYEAFDASGRSVCSSNGDGKAMRADRAGPRTEVACYGCDQCSFATAGGNSCKLFGRISVQIEGQSNPLGTYVLRTASINTIRTFETNLRAYHALFGKRLRGVEFNLKLRPMQSKVSDWETFFVVDLELRAASLKEAVKQAEQAATETAGLDFEALNQVLAAGLNNGNANDMSAVTDGVDLTEFYPASSFASTHRAVDTQTQVTGEESVAQVEKQASKVAVLHPRPVAAQATGTHGGALVEGFDLPVPGAASAPAIFATVPAGRPDVTTMTADF